MTLFHPAYGPEVRAAISLFRRPRMPMPPAQAAIARGASDSAQPSEPDRPVRFALFKEIHSLARPIVFPDLDALCARIHRDRAGRGIELQDAPLLFRQGEPPVDGVSIWIRTDDGLRGDFLGYAWADGRRRQALEAALYAREPVAVLEQDPHGEAA